jgi:transporter family-2 protein
MNPVLLYPFILVAGALQAAGNSMNAKLRNALVNPWLAATVSFSLIVFVFAFIFMVRPSPLPTLDQLAQMRWWGPFGGLAGAVAVFGGLAFVDKVGAGPFNGLLITANILTSLAIDHFGWFGMGVNTQTLPHLAGGALMVAGIALIAKF